MVTPGPEWAVNGTTVGTVIAEVRSPRKLELTVRADNATKNDVLQPLDANAGKLDVLVDEDGTYKTIDRSETGNVYYLTPPTSRSGASHPRQAGWYLVEDYEQTVVDQSGDQYEVTIEFVPQNHTEATGVVSEDETTGEWHFDMKRGSISTGRVSRKTKAKARDAVGMREVELIATNAEAETLESNFHRTAATRVVNVPDGENRSVDNSGGWCTVDVAAPENDTGFLPPGTYHVHGWSTTWVSGVRYRVALEVFRA